ncbi:Proteasome subunit beta type-4 [Savitreella phatthalungensis]
MEVLIGVRGPGYVLLASNLNQVRGITIMKPDDDKSRVLNKHNLMLYSGEPGDTVQFAEYVTANVALYSRRNEELELHTEAVSSFVRRELADSLRSRHPYQVNLLIGGYDITDDTAKLYWIDYLGTKAEVPYAAQGYASYYLLSMFDRHMTPETPMEEALALLKKGYEELERRMPLSLGGFVTKCVDKDGVRVVDVTRGIQLVA